MPRSVAVLPLRLPLTWLTMLSALLVAAFASRDVLAKEQDARLAESAAWNRPALAKPFVVSVPSGGGSVMLKAFDIKRDPGDIITMEA